MIEPNILPQCLRGIGIFQAKNPGHFLKVDRALDVFETGVEELYDLIVHHVWNSVSGRHGDCYMAIAVESDRLPNNMKVFSGKNFKGKVDVGLE